jgi:hypothetical protein
MSIVPSESTPNDAELAAFRRDAREMLDAYAALLQNPAFQHNIDIAVLTKIAGDDDVPHRVRLRAAEVLAKLRLEAMAALAELSAVRQQVMRELGLEDGPTSVSVTQVNTRIEIVRSDDWRNADGEIVDVETEPSGERPADP